MNLEEYRKHMKSKFNEDVQDAYSRILKNKEWLSIIEFCKDFGTHVDIKLAENVAVESGKASFCYYFAKDVIGANKTRLLNAIIDKGSVVYFILFNENVRNVTLKELKQLYKTNPEAQESTEILKLHINILEENNELEK